MFLLRHHKYTVQSAYMGGRQKGINMKKSVLLSLVAALCTGAAFASDYYQVRTNDCRMESMQNVLDRATAARRAVITVVRCDQVVRRYRPTYVPDVTHTRVRAVCGK